MPNGICLQTLLFKYHSYSRPLLQIIITNVTLIIEQYIQFVYYLPVDSAVH